MVCIIVVRTSVMTFDPPTPARRQSLAAELRARRRAAGKTLEQVAAETRIPVSALAAIEAGDTDELPNEVVGKGFAIAYAQAVGADAELIRGRWGGRAKAPVIDPVPPQGRSILWIAVAVSVLLLISVLLALLLEAGGPLEGSAFARAGAGILPVHSDDGARVQA